jgi:hypothetical protein
MPTNMTAPAIATTASDPRQPTAGIIPAGATTGKIIGQEGGARLRRRIYRKRRKSKVSICYCWLQPPSENVGLVLGMKWRLISLA